MTAQTRDRKGVGVFEAEEVTYWYLRLNGFLTIRNLVVHPDTGPNQVTDVDVLGVRFPYRAELYTRPMPDDLPFIRETQRPFVVFAEVTSRQPCKINCPWNKPDTFSLALKVLGILPEAQVDQAAKSLRERGVYESEVCYCTVLCFGGSEDEGLRKSHPEVPQKLWPDVLRFIHTRFVDYSRVKISHKQWDDTGQRLYDLAHVTKYDPEAFVQEIRDALG